MCPALCPFTHATLKQRSQGLYEFGNQPLSREVALVTSVFKTVTHVVPEPKESVKLFDHLINGQQRDNLIFQLKVEFAQV